MGINRNVKDSQNGYNLVEVSKTDDEGNLLSISYEVTGPGGFIKYFSSFEEANITFYNYQNSQSIEEEENTRKSHSRRQKR